MRYLNFPQMFPQIAVGATMLPSLPLYSTVLRSFYCEGNSWRQNRALATSLLSGFFLETTCWIRDKSRGNKNGATTADKKVLRLFYGNFRQIQDQKLINILKPLIDEYTIGTKKPMPGKRKTWDPMKMKGAIVALRAQKTQPPEFSGCHKDKIGARNDNLEPKNRAQRRKTTEKKIGGRSKTTFRTQMYDKSEGQTIDRNSEEWRLNFQDTQNEASSKRLQCLLGLDRSSDCPVDGGWSQWTTWGKCSGDCGQTGHRTRERLCNNPPPSKGGAQCLGSDIDTEPCVLPGCSEDEYWKMIRTDPLRSKEFDILRTTHKTLPDLSEACLSNECRFSEVETIIKDKNKAVIRGGWTQWSNWSPCTAVCGPGSKFRERSCTSPSPSSPELSCLGSSYENTTCNGVACAPRQDGVWSLWVSWSKCSVTCGNGIKTRTRECMKPPEKRALVEGKDNIMEWRLIRELDVSNMCSGPNKEIENCHNHDCAVKRNEVAMLNGEGSILYGASGRASRLLHMYLRFQPLNPSGTLLHRYNERCMGEGCDYVGLTLEGGFLVLNAQVSGCFVSTINPNRISVGEWHEVLLTVTGLVATLRIDDLPERSTSKFNCQPVHPNLDQAMRVGERFRGQIERMTVNYRPLRLRRGKVVRMKYDSIRIECLCNNNSLAPLVKHCNILRSTGSAVTPGNFSDTPVLRGSKGVPRGAAPYGIFGVEFEVGDSEESYVKLVGKETIRVPCPPNDNTLQIELAVKPEKPNGLLLYMPGDATGDYILISLESGRIKMRRIYGEVESVVECPTEILPGKWLSLYVDEGERKGDIGMSINGEPRIFLTPIDLDNTTQKILKAQSSAIVLEPLKGTLGFLAVNEHYEEVVMLLGRDLNIACLYDAENSIKISHEKKRDLRKKTTWLRLDVPVKVETEHNPDSASFSVKDDGRTTQLFSTSYLSKEAIEGFYICWVRRVSGGKGKVLMAYGVSVVDPAIDLVHTDAFFEE
ncbi:hypothetical protein C0J52_12564 [Blattella germanica]|nr:hypothetical protein C0J52_12564 [Blattella germanica]